MEFELYKKVIKKERVKVDLTPDIMHGGFSIWLDNDYKLLNISKYGELTFNYNTLKIYGIKVV